MIKKMTLWSMAGLALVIAVIFVVNLRVALQARDFLQQFTEVKAGASATDILELKKRYGAYIGPQDQGDNFIFDNHWLARFRLARPVVFMPYFQVSEGEIKGVGFSVAGRDQIGSSGAGHFWLHVSPNPRLSGSPVQVEERLVKNARHVFVLVSANADEQSRKRAFAFKWQCLMNFGGCSSPEEMLPYLLQFQTESKR